MPHDRARDSFLICVYDSLQGVRLWLVWSIGIHEVGFSAWKALAVMPSGLASGTIIVFRLGSKGHSAVLCL